MCKALIPWCYECEHGGNHFGEQHCRIFTDHKTTPAELLLVAETYREAGSRITHSYDAPLYEDVRNFLYLYSDDRILICAVAMYITTDPQWFMGCRDKELIGRLSR